MTPTRIELPIVSVLVTEDRARITRRGTISLDRPGDVSVEDVSPAIVDRTLRGHVIVSAGPSQAIPSLRAIRRRFSSTEAFPEKVRLLSEERTRIHARVASTTQRLKDLEEHCAAVASAANLTLAEVVEDAASGVGTRDVWTERLDLHRAARRALDEEAADVSAQLEELRREADSIDARYRDLEAGPAVDKASLELTIPVAGEAQVVLEYEVGNACWRPLHHAEQGDGTVHVMTDACVWQRTGEAWRDVELTFSTERTADVTDPPVLTSDHLAMRPKDARARVQVREETIQTTGLGTEQLDEPPAADDGGTTRTLRAEGTHTIEADGKAHRVQVAAFDSPAQTSLRCTAELSSHIFRVTALQNTSDTPLLAGPIELTRRGAVIGRSSIGYLNPGEHFELAWGGDPGLFVAREEDTQRVEVGLLSSDRMVRTERRLQFVNRSPSPRRLQVRERILVSETEKVRVQVDRNASSAFVFDEDGIGTLEVELPARGRLDVRLAFTIRAASDVQGLGF